jgi:hypothetical protein
MNLRQRTGEVNSIPVLKCWLGVKGLVEWQHGGFTDNIRRALHWCRTPKKKRGVLKANTGRYIGWTTPVYTLYTWPIASAAVCQDRAKGETE